MCENIDVGEAKKVPVRIFSYKFTMNNYLIDFSSFSTLYMEKKQQLNY